MDSYRKIFVIADANRPCSAAVRRGAQLAQRSGAALTLALFEYDRAVERAAEQGSGPREAFVVKRRQWLQSQVGPFLDPAIRARIEAVWAPQQREAILGAILAEKPDLVIKDIGHESALKRLVATPLDWQLLRTVPVPLMLVQPKSTHLPRRVLAAVDPVADAGEHPLNARVVEAARVLAACSDARVDVAHAFAHDPAQQGVLGGVYAELEKEDQDLFGSFAAAQRVPLERRHWVVGETEAAMRRLARLLRAELLVLGSVYRSKLERFSIGTTAESLIQHSAQDVLLVKPESFVEELGRHFNLQDLRQHHLAAA